MTCHSAMMMADYASYIPHTLNPHNMILIGSWRDQLRTLNLKLMDNNSNVQKKRHVKIASEYEWWALWGIIFAACPVGKGGQFLFQNAKERKIVQGVNFGKDGLDVMSWTRFKQIKEQIHFAFYDYTCPDDPYHPVRTLVDGYNDNRKQNVASSIKIVLDESMSPFKPRTSKTSGWPNISFIFRKPKPLGCEQKVCCRLFCIYASVSILSMVFFIFIILQYIPK